MPCRHHRASRGRVGTRRPSRSRPQYSQHVVALLGLVRRAGPAHLILFIVQWVVCHCRGMRGIRGERHRLLLSVSPGTPLLSTSPCDCLAVCPVLDRLTESPSIPLSTRVRSLSLLFSILPGLSLCVSLLGVCAVCLSVWLSCTLSRASVLCTLSWTEFLGGALRVIEDFENAKSQPEVERGPLG